jgi:hypothetical protein
VVAVSLGYIQSVPPPRRAEHHIRPDYKASTTRLYCSDGLRSLTIKEAPSGGFKVASGRRKSNRLSRAALSALTADLRRELVHVAEVFGMCGSGNDLIYFSGSQKGGAQVIVEFIWKANRLTRSANPLVPR